MYVDKE